MPLLPWRVKKSKVEDLQLQGVPYDSLIGENQPKDLWDRAHRLLRENKSSRQLLLAYERILLSELDQDAPPVSSVDWGSRDRTRQVSDLIAKKLKVIEDTRWRLQLGRETVDVKDQVDKVVKTVIWAQGFVSSAVSADPHSALAWAGVSLLLPLLLNPTSQNLALLDGLDYISTLIARFTVVERTYRQQVSSQKVTAERYQMSELEYSFELQLTKLYSQILAYQARVVCQLPRNALVRYGRDVLKVDGWSTMLAEIKTTESNCSAMSDLFNTERVDAAWKEQESRMDELSRSYEEHSHILRQTTEQLAQDLKHGIDEQRDWRRTEEETKCLQALCTSTYVDHKNLNPDRVPGTCQWVLKNEKFYDWAESDTSGLLWITADPGCGKSVLSKSLVDCELQSTLSLTTAYYFFKDDSPEQRSATNALCAMVHQICSQNRALLRTAVDAYQNNGGRLTRSFALMWNLLLAIAQQPEAGEVICIVDALDECQSSDKTTLIGALNEFNTSRKSFEGRLKFLVTSRAYYDIEESFDENTIRLTGEDESETIKREIDLVIEDRVPKLAARKKLDDKTRAALQDRLLQTENRTYLWLHLTLDGVEKGFGLATPQKMKAFIGKLPRTINQAYESMMLRCPEPEQARKLLHVILAAVRPLTLCEANMALNIERGQKSPDDVDLYPEETFGTYVKNLCGLLVRISNSRIYFLHQTVKEFLIPLASATDIMKHIDSGGLWKHSMDPMESNLFLARKCMYYLSSDERSNVWCCGKNPHDDRWHRTRDPFYSLKFVDHENGFLNYTALHWTYHFKFAREEPELLELWFQVCDRESKSFVKWSDKWFNRNGILRLTESIRQKMSLLSLASTFGHDAIVRQLLKKTAVVDVEGPRSLNPLICAAKYGHEDVVSTLIKAGASLEDHDYEKMTPLALAAEHGNKNVARVLIKEGASIETRDKHQNTPLILAAEKGRSEVIKIMLEAGATTEARDIQGNTPLMIAARRSHHAAVQELIIAGAQTDATNNDGEAALMIATHYGHSKMVEMLSEAAELKQEHLDSE